MEAIEQKGIFQMNTVIYCRSLCEKQAVRSKRVSFGCPPRLTESTAGTADEPEMNMQISVEYPTTN